MESSLLYKKCLVVHRFKFTCDLRRYDDPDSAQSSFSMLLGDAPHLDGTYAIFGKVTKGDDTLKKLEELPTRREGIFVMPTERITILSSYYYDTNLDSCEEDRSTLKRRLAASFVEIERQRMKCFP
uniref:PPIase cyclophilin-type domain-containing protein n=1 Tax=Cucumis sativus TaxID=3659 RepID=A0A0A0LHV0_CUCSA